MRLIEHLRTFNGPVDERVQVESDRIYKIGFWVLTAGLVVYQYYGYWKAQVAWVYGLADNLYTDAYVDPFIRVLFFVALVLCIILAYRRGVSLGCASTHSLNSPDTSLVGLCLPAAGLLGLAGGLLTFAVRCVAQFQLLGLERMRPLDDVVIGLVMAFQIAVLCFFVMLAFSYLEKRRLAKLDALPDD